MGILITKAILHVVYNDGRQPIISTEELDFESEACYEFINKHIKKLLNDNSCKNATFNPGSEFYTDLMDFINEDFYFKEFSTKIFEKISKIITINSEIPSADILIVKFSKDDVEHIGIIKLNYKDFFTHKTDYTEKGADNQIIKYTSALPFGSGKVEEACIIPFSPMVIRLIEKSYPINGENTFYFSKLFLDCECEISKKESVAIVNEVSEEINSKFFEDRIDTEAKIKTAMIEEAEENEGTVRMENVANKVFGEDIEIKKEFIETLKEAGVKEDLQLGESFVRNQFGVQRFKSENGVEVKFPSELGLDEDSIEFKHHGDGSMTLILKNLRKK